MKTRITFLALLIVANLGFAQEENVPDTTRFTIGKTEFIIIDSDTTRVNDANENDDIDDPDNENKKDYLKKKNLAHWAGFEIGVNMLMNNQFQPDFQENHLQLDPAKSFTYNFNLFEYFIKFGTPHIGLVTGLGFTNARFGIKNSNVRLYANTDSTYGAIDTTLLNGFKTNQLRVTYINVPLLIQINTSMNKRKNLNFAFGIIGGVRLGSKMFYKYEQPEGNTAQTTEGKFNINPFHASLTARIGYRKIGLFANFNMLPLFENDKSRVAKPLTFGASFIF